MSNTQPIQFLLHQLATNEQDRERFNQNIFGIECELIRGEAFFRLRPNETIFNNQFFNFNILLQIAIIRTCLSRVNGEAVLTVFGGGFTNWIHRETEEVLSLAIEIKKPKNYYRSDTIYILDTLYEAFDEPLRNGKPRDEATQTLHDKMLELVPEYQEFLN